MFQVCFRFKRQRTAEVRTHICLVNIDFDEHKGCEFTGVLCEDGADHLAWAAPSGCEVYNHLKAVGIHFSSLSGKCEQMQRLGADTEEAYGRL